MPFLYTTPDGVVHLVQSVVGDGLTWFKQAPEEAPKPVSIDNSSSDEQTNPGDSYD